MDERTIRRAQRPIADYGAIGDGRSVALVSRDGSVDWWCPGRFDAPSVFAHLLDPARGGSFLLAPASRASSRQAYLPDTNVLSTRHDVEGEGAVDVVDFLVHAEDSAVDGSVLVRRVRGVAGAVRMRARFEPRFHYGRVPARLLDSAASLLARGAGQALRVDAPLAWRRVEGGRDAEFTVAAGESVDIVVRHAPADAPSPFALELGVDAETLERRTTARWRAWSERTVATGPYAALVRRSALAVKLLHFEPTGAFVAAATASLPEDLGGARNWDYRFAWLRDGAWSAHALGKLGHHEEEAAFRAWTSRIVEREGLPLRVLYTIAGTSDTVERELPHLRGYRGSRPVRIGNGARDQHQLDTYGEIVEFLLRDGGRPDGARWARVREVVDWVAENWRAPDQGIWEMRCPPRHFVLSKAMAWVALSRAAAVAREHGLDGDVDAWEREARVVRAEVLERGYDAARGSFLQAYDHPHLDASNLLLPLIGFVDADDPRMVSTVEATLRELTVDGLVYRYIDAGDGLPGGEATFAYCTFWLIEVLSRQGRVEEARRLFEGMLRHASPLGLYAEEIEARTGEHLGNFPQAFPHIGLIHAALALEAAEAAAAATPASSVVLAA